MKTLLATRQSWRRAGRPALAQPCSYIGQCDETQGGYRKLPEIGIQPRSAAAATPLEKGETAVTTIGGCGFWKGVMMMPWPISAISVRLVDIFQNLPSSS